MVAPLAAPVQALAQDGQGDLSKRAAYLSAVAEVITASVKVGWLAFAIGLAVAHLAGCPVAAGVELDGPGLRDVLQLGKP